jgi:hypothetical protein
LSSRDALAADNLEEQECGNHVRRSEGPIRTRGGSKLERILEALDCGYVDGDGDAQLNGKVYNHQLQPPMHHLWKE